MTGHSRGATDKWLQELSALTGSVVSEAERGEFLLRVHSAVANLKHDNIADLVGLILETGAWRSYTYPSGEHYEFRAREFDYFLAQQDIDPRMVRDAASYSDDGELRALLVESSLDVVNEDRRSVEEIVQVYPRLGPWLEKYGLRALGPKAAYDGPAARERMKSGGSTSSNAVRQRWEVVSPDPDSLPGAIARRLERDGIAGEVVEELVRLGVRTIVTPIVTGKINCMACGEPFDPRSGKARYCSQVCRNRAGRQRKRQAN